MNIEQIKARVFDAKVSENRQNTVQANVSTYEGKNQDGTKKYSSWRTYFVGASYDMAKTLENGDAIIIINGKVVNTYNKEKKRLYVNIFVFEFEIQPERKSNGA